MSMIYGQFIFEYLEDIAREFDHLQIQTLGQLRKELETRVSKYLFETYKGREAESILLEFVKGTRDQQCSKVIVNDFKRSNFSVNSPISKFNLFYYNDHLQGFTKYQITAGDQNELRITKLDERKLPADLVVYWRENSKKKQGYLKDYQ